MRDSNPKILLKKYRDGYEVGEGHSEVRTCEKCQLVA